jgi:hypothetical protein
MGDLVILGAQLNAAAKHAHNVEELAHGCHAYVAKSCTEIRKMVFDKLCDSKIARFQLPDADVRDALIVLSRMAPDRQKTFIDRVFLPDVSAAFRQCKFSLATAFLRKTNNGPRKILLSQIRKSQFINDIVFVPSVVASWTTDETVHRARILLALVDKSTLYALNAEQRLQLSKFAYTTGYIIPSMVQQAEIFRHVYLRQNPVLGGLVESLAPPTSTMAAFISLLAAIKKELFFDSEDEEPADLSMRGLHTIASANNLTLLQIMNMTEKDIKDMHQVTVHRGVDYSHNYRPPSIVLPAELVEDQATEELESPNPRDVAMLELSNEIASKQHVAATRLAPVKTREVVAASRERVELAKAAFMNILEPTKEDWLDVRNLIDKFGDDEDDRAFIEREDAVVSILLGEPIVVPVEQPLTPLLPGCSMYDFPMTPPPESFDLNSEWVDDGFGMGGKAAVTTTATQQDKADLQSAVDPDTTHTEMDSRRVTRNNNSEADAEVPAVAMGPPKKRAAKKVESDDSLPFWKQPFDVQPAGVTLELYDTMLKKLFGEYVENINKTSSDEIARRSQVELSLNEQVQSSKGALLAATETVRAHADEIASLKASQVATAQEDNVKLDGNNAALAALRIEFMNERTTNSTLVAEKAALATERDETAKRLTFVMHDRDSFQKRFSEQDLSISNLQHEIEMTFVKNLATYVEQCDTISELKEQVKQHESDESSMQIQQGVIDEERKVNDEERDQRHVQNELASTSQQIQRQHHNDVINARKDKQNQDALMSSEARHRTLQDAGEASSNEIFNRFNQTSARLDATSAELLAAQGEIVELKASLAKFTGRIKTPLYEDLSTKIVNLIAKKLAREEPSDIEDAKENLKKATMQARAIFTEKFRPKLAKEQVMITGKHGVQRVKKNQAAITYGDFVSDEIIQAEFDRLVAEDKEYMESLDENGAPRKKRFRRSAAEKDEDDEVDIERWTKNMAAVRTKYPAANVDLLRKFYPLSNPSSNALHKLLDTDSDPLGFYDEYEMDLKVSTAEYQRRVATTTFEQLKKDGQIPRLYKISLRPTAAKIIAFLHSKHDQLKYGMEYDDNFTNKKTNAILVDASAKDRKTKNQTAVSNFIKGRKDISQAAQLLIDKRGVEESGDDISDDSDSSEDEEVIVKKPKSSKYKTEAEVQAAAAKPQKRKIAVDAVPSKKASKASAESAPPASTNGKMHTSGCSACGATGPGARIFLQVNDTMGRGWCNRACRHRSTGM